MTNNTPKMGYLFHDYFICIYLNIILLGITIKKSDKCGLKEL